MAPQTPRYDPWHDLRENWPEVRVVIEAMPDPLLGYVNYPVIALRADTSHAQRRCTLAHELVHLERGISECGPFAEREERQVHQEVARRLVPVDLLSDALRVLGTTADPATLASALEVDQETLLTRIALLTIDEIRRLGAPPADDLWSVA